MEYTMCVTFAINIIHWIFITKMYEIMNRLLSKININKLNHKRVCNRNEIPIWHISKQTVGLPEKNK